MPIADRAVLLPETRAQRLSDWRLRETIRLNGQQVAVLYWRNELLDGARRIRLGRILHFDVQVHHARCEQEAARLLWDAHPRRAWLRFVRDGMKPRRIAWLLGCGLSEVPSPHHFAEHMRRLERSRAVRGTERAAVPGVQVPRAALEAAHAHCKASGTTLSARIRELVHQLASD